MKNVGRINMTSGSSIYHLVNETAKHLVPLQLYNHFNSVDPRTSCVRPFIMPYICDISTIM